MIEKIKKVLFENNFKKQCFNDIFGKQLVYIIGSLIFVILLFKTPDLIRQNKFLNIIFLCLLLFLSVLFLVECMVYIYYSFKDRKLDRFISYNKKILFVREFVLFLISLILLFSLLASIFQLSISRWFVQVAISFTMIKFAVRLLAFFIGIPDMFALIYLLSIFIILAIIGAFDLKVWAIVTALLGIWDYINSKDFIVFLRKGKEIKQISEELMFRFQLHKLLSKSLAVFLYFSVFLSDWLLLQCNEDNLKWKFLCRIKCIINNSSGIEKLLNRGVFRFSIFILLSILFLVLLAIIIKIKVKKAGTNSFFDLIKTTINEE